MVDTKQEILLRKIRKLGFSVFPHEKDSPACMMKNICKAEVPSEAELLALLRLLSRSYRIEFYDHYQPPFTREGVYCTAVVLSPERVFYWQAGQGWGGDWQEVPLAEFAALLQLNWNKSSKEGGYENYFTLMDNVFGLPRLAKRR